MRVYTQKVTTRNEYICILRILAPNFNYSTTLGRMETDAWNSDAHNFNAGYTFRNGKSVEEVISSLNLIHERLEKYLGALPPSKMISATRVKEIIGQVLKRKPNERQISADYQQYIIERATSKHWKERTIARERYVYRLFMAYVGEAEYSDFDAAYMEGFAEHLKQTIHDENLKKAISSVGTFLKWARAHGKPVPNERYVYHYNRGVNPIIYLSKTELHKIIHYKIPPTGEVVFLRTMRGRRYEKKVMASESLKLVRDLLLFGCLTGLRWSEIQMLTPSHINDGMICFVAPKTDSMRRVNLNRFARDIIDKYRYIDGKNGFLFPKLSNQKANKHLHELAELCGINEPVTRLVLENGEKNELSTPKYEFVTTHIGRRTFVCQALLSGLTPELVTLWTGHASVDDMKPYIAATGESQTRSMKAMYGAMFRG